MLKSHRFDNDIKQPLFMLKIFDPKSGKSGINLVKIESLDSDFFYSPCSLLFNVIRFLQFTKYCKIYCNNLVFILLNSSVYLILL